MHLTDLQRGATLVELIISIVVISVGVMGILSVISGTARYSVDPMMRHQAVAIAESYMEEIMVKSFSDPDDSQVCAALGIDSGENTRTDFDDIDDYHNLSNNGCSSSADGACNQFGDGIMGLQAYSVTVTVSCDAFGDVAATRSKKIDVVVSHSAGFNVALSGYRISVEP